MSIARRQFGVIGRDQCRAAGLSDRQIDSLISRGCLRSAGRGVLRVAGAPVQPETAMWSAVLATRGVLVATSAAFVWQLVPVPPRYLQLAIPADRRAVAPAGTVVRRCDIPAAELTTRFGLPVTSRRRSALDHLASSTIVEATTFADRAISQGWLAIADLEGRLATRTLGNPIVRRVLGTLSYGAEAESERRLHRLLSAAGIAGWVPNHPVRLGGRLVARIDIAFVELRIAIEVDGIAYHGDRNRFQRDRARQNTLVTAGWTVLRFTWEDLTCRPERVVAIIAAAIRRAA